MLFVLGSRYLNLFYFLFYFIQAIREFTKRIWLSPPVEENQALDAYPWASLGVADAYPDKIALGPLRNREAIRQASILFLQSDAANQAIAVKTASDSEGGDSDDAADQMLGRETRASLQFQDAAVALAGEGEGNVSLTPLTARMRIVIGKSPDESEAGAGAQAEGEVSAQPPPPPPLVRRLWGQGKEIMEAESEDGDADHVTTEEYDGTVTGVQQSEEEEEGESSGGF
jgi:hypothetical protein